MDDRKARLAALAARAGRTQTTKTTSDESMQDTRNNDETPAASSSEQRQGLESKSVSFRNYTPADNALEQTNNNDEGPPTKKAKPAKTALQLATERAKVEAAAAASTTTATTGMHAAPDEEMLPATAAAPQKINGDLKRDIQTKLDKLERRTQKAIVQLLRERLDQEAREAEEGQD